MRPEASLRKLTMVLLQIKPKSHGYYSFTVINIDIVQELA